MHFKKDKHNKSVPHRLSRETVYQKKSKNKLLSLQRNQITEYEDYKINKKFQNNIFSSSIHSSSTSNQTLDNRKVIFDLSSLKGSKNQYVTVR